MGTSPFDFLQLRYCFIISGSHQDPQGLLTAAWHRVLQAYRPATTQAHRTHFATYLSVLSFYSLPKDLSPQNILIFLEFLAKNHLSPKVIKNYFSSISSLSKFYHLEASGLSHPAVLRFLRSLSINSTFRPTPRGVFGIPIKYDISKACDSLQDPLDFKAF